MTHSVFVAEVTQVNSISVFPIHPDWIGMSRCMRLSSVKVTRPASPFITHETSRLGEGIAVAVSRGRVKNMMVFILFCFLLIYIVELAIANLRH